jgi:hypothetical protein
MSEAVFVYLWGGLGNQLFQYAAGMALTDQLRSELYLLPAQENGHSARDYRRGLMPRGRPADAHVGQLTTDARFWPSDSHAAWNPTTVCMEVEAHVKRLLVRGYFQYLPAIQPQVARIRADILDRMVDVRHGLAVKYRIRDPRAVASLHVRRGDYVGLQGKGFHLLGPEYYVPAIAAVQASAGSQGPPQRWLIFSNDPAWCRSQPWLPAGAEVVEETDEVATLLLLSLCQAVAVTSNSTFSWWGAVLAAPQTVTYSKRWIGDATPALFPHDWIRI